MRKFWHIGLAVISPIILFLNGCITIERVDQPTQARSNTVFTTTVVASPNVYPGNGQPYLGIHLPTNWAIITPISYTGGYTGSLTYDTALSTQMENASSEDGYYWWVGKGDPHEVLSSGQAATATLQLQTAGQAGFYHLDYVVGESNGEPNGDLKETFPITVTAPYGSGWKINSSLQYNATTITKTISATLIDLGDAGVDSFDLSITPPTGWQANFYTNTVITNTGAMTVFQKLPLKLQLVPPPEVSPGSTVITFSARSTSDENVAALTTVELTLLSDQRGYALTNNNAIRAIDPVVRQLAQTSGISLGYAESLAVHPGGQYIYVTFPDNVFVWPGYYLFEVVNLATGDSKIRYLPEGAKLGIVEFTCNGSQALVSDRSANRLFLLKTTTPAIPFQIGTITNLPGIVNEIAQGGCNSGLVLTTHKNSDTVAIIDRDLVTVVKTISGFNAPGDIVVTADGQRAYVANADGTIGVIDLTNQTFVGNIDTGNTTSGHLAISPDGKKLFIGAGNRLLVMGEKALFVYFQGTVIQDIEVSPDGQTIYVAHNPTAYWEDGSIISIVQADTLQVVDTIRVDDKLRDLTLFSPVCDCRQTYLPLVVK